MKAAALKVASVMQNQMDFPPLPNKKVTQVNSTGNVFCPWGFLETSTSQPKSNETKKVSFSTALRQDQELPNLSSLSEPSFRGDTVVVKIDEKIYQKQLEECKTNLIGRMILPKGSSPLKLEDLKKHLKIKWNVQETWRLVPIGRGYYDIHFSSPTDMMKAWSGGSCSLSPGVFRLSQWKQDFNPYEIQKMTHFQVWIRIYNLSQEYWHPKTLMEISKGVGIPLQIDHATRERRYGIFARVLVEIDLSRTLPQKLFVERKGFGFFVEIKYENLPITCTNCGIIGHELSKCRLLEKEKDQTTKRKDETNTLDPEKDKGKQTANIKHVTEIGEEEVSPRIDQVSTGIGDNSSTSKGAERDKLTDHSEGVRGDNSLVPQVDFTPQKLIWADMLEEEGAEHKGGGQSQNDRQKELVDKGKHIEGISIGTEGDEDGSSDFDQIQREEYILAANEEEVTLWVNKQTKKITPVKNRVSTRSRVIVKPKKYT